MRLATVSQSRRIDERTQEAGVPAELLMEAAGVQSANEIEQCFIPELKTGPVGVICGPGNNGADGLVVARHLHSSGHKDVVVFILAPEKMRSELFATQLKRCASFKIPVLNLEGSESERASAFARLSKMHLLVDAIFGIGLRRGVEGVFAQVIKEINRLRIPVVSLDVPSGLDADRGVAIGGVAVRAHTTLTLGLYKPGLFIADGPQLSGHCRRLSIGFPQQVIREIACSHFTWSENHVRRFLPKRPHRANKANFGKALVFAGRPGMWGASVLAASAAYRVGAGYVISASHFPPTEIVQQIPEILTVAADDENLWLDQKWKVAAVGPGLGLGEKTLEVLKRLQQRELDGVVVDADAITVLAQSQLGKLPSTWVLTPHSGELSRLLQVEVEEIEQDRVRYAHLAAEKFGCLVLLKGFRSILTDGKKNYFIMSGNSALAKAGTGDVLTGMMVGLMAQGLSPFKAAGIGAYIHGRMADEWLRAGNGQASLQASDLCQFLPHLMASLRANPKGYWKEL